MIDQPNKLTLLDRAISVFTGASGAQDLCKRLVHADFAKSATKGAYLYSIDARSMLVELAGYGMPFAESGAEFLIWDDHPVAKCVRDRKLVCHDEKNLKLICLPFEASDVPTGALVIVCDIDVELPPFAAELVPAISKLGGYFINTSGISLNRGTVLNSPSVSLEEITTRQVSILNLMADGLTNAEIAGKVLLSESTVRQETIRIYRALAVNGRLEAIAKARALGLISKVTPPRT
jgi:DNA-binding CsgD family transcriptional regulator